MDGNGKVQEGGEQDEEQKYSCNLAEGSGAGRGPENSSS